jgi:hypothetical protein
VTLSEPLRAQAEQGELVAADERALRRLRGAMERELLQASERCRALTGSTCSETAQAVEVGCGDPTLTQGTQRSSRAAAAPCQHHASVTVMMGRRPRRARAVAEGVARSWHAAAAVR